MRHLIFQEADQYPVALLTKPVAFNRRELQEAYIEPWQQQGLSPDQVIAFTLATGPKGKVSAKLAKEYLDKLLPALVSLGVRYLYVTDGEYFKALTGARKADPHYGYVLPCKWENYTDLQVVLGVNHKALFYNPELQVRLNLTLETLARHYQGSYRPIGEDIIHHEAYPESLVDIRQQLNQLHQYPALTCDIETFSLVPDEAGIGTITFCWNQHEGVAFAVDYVSDPQAPYGTRQDNQAVKALLREFFENYQGNLKFHRANFDVKVLIYELWMADGLDNEGLLQGLEILTRNFDDTKIIAYLALNSTSKGKYSLKELAQPFAGNWAQSEINNILAIPLPELLRYNLVDGLSTWYVYNTYQPRMAADQQETLYQTLMLPSLIDIIQMELTGMPLDPTRVQEVKTELQGIVDTHTATLRQSPLIQQVEEFLTQRAWERDYTERKAKAKNPDKIQPKDWDTFPRTPFNPNSGDHLTQLLYEKLQLPVIDYTEGKLPATGDKTLAKLMNHTQDPETLKIIEALRELGKAGKILDAFIPSFEQATDRGGEVRWLLGSFNLGGTVSGRMSSCVAPWTRIQTQRGLVPIIQLHVGDQVWTHKRRWRPVLDVIQKPAAKMVDVHFCTGYVLTCTTAHRLKVPNRGWLTVQEIIDERIEEVDAEPCQYPGCPGAVPRYPADPDSRQDCGDASNHRTQRRTCREISHSTGGADSSQGTALFCLQDRGSEPHERQNWRTASQLYRRLRRWLRLPDPGTQRETAVCTPDRDGRGTWLDRIARVFSCASYRRQPAQQCAGQPGTVYPERTSENSQPAGHERCGKIQAIYPRAITPVWDITVEGDHSYWAEGCFNHNSNPNLQQLPSGSVHGPLVKSCFKAPKGWILCGADFNALEARIDALLTKDPNKLKVLTEGYDSHSFATAGYWPDQFTHLDDSVEAINSIQKTHKELRQKSKGVSFAKQYGGTYITLMNNSGFSEEEAKRIEANYDKLYVVSKQWKEEQIQKVAEQGYAVTAFGLKIRAPVLAQTVRGGRRTPYEAEAEARTLGNALGGQSYGLLNNRAMMAFMRKVRTSKYRHDIKPIAMIHDSIYLLVRDQVEIVEWVNRELIQEMEWNELPEIQHPQVKLGAELEVHYKGWHQPITLPNNADCTLILQKCEEGIRKYSPDPEEAQEAA